MANDAAVAGLQATHILSSGEAQPGPRRRDQDQCRVPSMNNDYGVFDRTEDAYGVIRFASMSPNEGGVQ
jgi:hypothetical protein